MLVAWWFGFGSVIVVVPVCCWFDARSVGVLLLHMLHLGVVFRMSVCLDTLLCFEVNFFPGLPGHKGMMHTTWSQLMHDVFVATVYYINNCRQILSL